MAVTLKDIAERVGKSVPTVSRALGGHTDISPVTRREVQRVARELGYVPNASARDLQKRRVDALGLIVPASRNLLFSDPFFSEFLAGVVERSTARGFVISVSADSHDDALSPYLEQIRSRRVAGFILVRLQREDPRVPLLKKNRIPFVAFGRLERENDFALVDDDDEAGIRLVIDHLVALGHRRIGFIGEPTGQTKPYHRFQGYRAGLAAHGIPYDSELVVESRYRPRSGKESARALLDRADRPSAIVAANDLLAIGALGAVREVGLTVGRDISVTGYDNIMVAEHSNPPLTTVDQPAHTLGSLVATRLIRLIHGESIEEPQTVLSPSLVVRQSTAPHTG